VLQGGWRHRRRIVQQGRICGSMPGPRGLPHPRSTYAVLIDSKGFMTVSSNWVGGGKDPLLRHSPDGDILARIIKVLHQRVDLGLFTIFIIIRAHRGEFLNEKADRWADEGRDDVGNVRWDGPSSYPTFSWTEPGVEHRCSMNKTLWGQSPSEGGLTATSSSQ